jgi:hypothetical protein
MWQTKKPLIQVLSSTTFHSVHYIHTQKHTWNGYDTSINIDQSKYNTTGDE